MRDQAKGREQSKLSNKFYKLPHDSTRQKYYRLCIYIIFVGDFIESIKNTVKKYKAYVVM